MSSDQAVSPASPRAVHVVDVTKGPLVGDGRLRRVLPFAVTATLSVLVAVPATSWAHPGLAVAGAVTVAVTIVASLVVPWQRAARAAQLASPFLFLAGTLLLAAAVLVIASSTWLQESTAGQIEAGGRALQSAWGRYRKRSD